MKILIITLHSIHNFGSIFQAYALQEYLNREGYIAEIIDYRPRYNNIGRNYIKATIGKILNLKSYYNTNKKFTTFIKKNMLLTGNRYNTYKKLCMNPPKADLYIVGGDQLWNPYHYSGQDLAFRLSFVNGKKKISYGTSMGKDNFTDSEINDLKESIKDFMYISVREKSSVQLLSKVGLKGVKHVADPVLLLNKENYLSIIPSRKIKEKYLLVYLVDRSELLKNLVNSIADKYNLKVVHVSGLRKKCDCNYFIKDAGPEEILSLLVHADFIVSASFHATLFSIMFNKRFCVLLPNINTNARILELLHFIGLEDRIIRNLNTIDRIYNEIPYNFVNPVIDKFVEESKQHLKNAIEKGIGDKWGIK